MKRQNTICGMAAAGPTPSGSQHTEPAATAATGPSKPCCGSCYSGRLEWMLWHRRAVFTSLRLSQGENGDLLGVGSAKRQLRTLLFYPNIYGVPKWYTTLPPSYRTPQGSIAQVSNTREGRRSHRWRLSGRGAPSARRILRACHLNLVRTRSRASVQALSPTLWICPWWIA